MKEYVVTPQTGFLAFRERQFLKPLFYVLLFVGVLLCVGKTFAFFDEPSLGFDKLLHFLGGVACGIFGVLLLSMGYWNSDALCTRKTLNIRVWIIAILAAFFVGVAYEILQMWLPAFRNGSAHNWYDTTGDMLFDVLGGIIAGLTYQIRRGEKK